MNKSKLNHAPPLISEKLQEILKNKDKTEKLYSNIIDKKPVTKDNMKIIYDNLQKQSEKSSKLIELIKTYSANDAVVKAQPLGCMKCELMDWRF